MPPVLRVSATACNWASKSGTSKIGIRGTGIETVYEARRRRVSRKGRSVPEGIWTNIEQ